MATIGHEEAGRIRAMLDDLIYLSEIESGALTLNLDDVDIDAVATDTVSRMKLQAAEAGVSSSHVPRSGRAACVLRSLAGEPSASAAALPALAASGAGTTIAVRPGEGASSIEVAMSAPEASKRRSIEWPGGGRGSGGGEGGTGEQTVGEDQADR